MTKEDLISYWESSRIIFDKKLIKAFIEIPRENFISKGYINEAYGNYPIPIGFGQTISQPTTVMLMIQELELKKNDRVLEIGSGSGYNAAIISRLVKIVYTIERLDGLAKIAKKNVKNYENIIVIKGDGSRGYEKEAPFDKIIITAACPKIPLPLIKQLSEKGIIIAPIGDEFSQVMQKGKKINNEMAFEKKGEFRFVPLIGKYGFNEK